jgi:hypothetical protein
MGLPNQTLFDSSALASATQEPRSVVHCLLALARVAHLKYGFEPPYDNCHFLVSCRMVCHVYFVFFVYGEW